MSCHIRRPFVACITAVVLTAGLSGPALGAGQPLHEDPPAVAGPEGFLGALWDWILGGIAPGAAFGSFRGAEGWGMDPNGGGTTALPLDGQP